MIKRSIHILKTNPIIVLIFSVYIIITILFIHIFYTDNLSPSFKLNRDLSKMIILIKTHLGLGLNFILGITFMSGFGYMLTEAIKTGRTKVTSFFAGITNFFLRILLVGLLLIDFGVGLSILISIVTQPIISMFLSLGFSSYNFQSTVITIISVISEILLMPFVLLWFPTIFLDDTGVIQGLKSGAKVGLKNYWRLV